MEESRGRGWGGGHIPPGGPGLHLATSPGCPAAGSPPPRPGQTDSRPAQTFFGAWPAPAHSPGSSCFDPPQTSHTFPLKSHDCGIWFFPPSPCLPSLPLPWASSLVATAGRALQAPPWQGLCVARAIGWAYLTLPGTSPILWLLRCSSSPPSGLSLVPSCLPMSKASERSP